MVANLVIIRYFVWSERKSPIAIQLVLRHRLVVMLLHEDTGWTDGKYVRPSATIRVELNRYIRWIERIDQRFRVVRLILVIDHAYVVLRGKLDLMVKFCVDV